MRYFKLGKEVLIGFKTKTCVKGDVYLYLDQDPFPVKAWHWGQLVGGIVDLPTKVTTTYVLLLYSLTNVCFNGLLGFVAILSISISGLVI